MTAPEATHPAEVDEVSAKPPLYPQLLRLKHVHPNAWQRALLGEGMALVGALLALADLASAWSILVLPVAVGAVVKVHDVVAGALPQKAAAEPEPEPVTVGSAELWQLVSEGLRRAEVHALSSVGVPVPMALLQTTSGITEVRVPKAASALTNEEQAAALRAGLRELAAREGGPDRVALLYVEAAKPDLQVAAYERGLRVGVLVSQPFSHEQERPSTPRVVSQDLPSVYPGTTKAPTP